MIPGTYQVGPIPAKCICDHIHSILRYQVYLVHMYDRPYHTTKVEYLVVYVANSHKLTVDATIEQKKQYICISRSPLKEAKRI